MRIPTTTLALVAAALSSSAWARLAKAPKAAAPAAPGPAYLATRDYAAPFLDARAATQKRQVDPSGITNNIPGGISPGDVTGTLPTGGTGGDSDPSSGSDSGTNSNTA